MLDEGRQNAQHFAQVIPTMLNKLISASLFRNGAYAQDRVLSDTKISALGRFPERPKAVSKKVLLFFFPPVLRGDRGGFLDAEEPPPTPPLVKEGSKKRHYLFRNGARRSERP